MEYSHSSSKTDRKTTERNRRNQMKALYSKLNSLVPHQSSRESVSLPDQLDEAANYIKKLQTNLEKMKERKDSLMGIDRPLPITSSSARSGSENGLRPPQIQIHETGSALEIVLITGLHCQFLFNETVRVIHEEGAEIVNANFSVVDDTVFHTIHSEVGDTGPSNEAARISARLKRFVEDAGAT